MASAEAITTRRIRDPPNQRREAWALSAAHVNVPRKPFHPPSARGSAARAAYVRKNGALGPLSSRYVTASPGLRREPDSQS